VWRAATNHRVVEFLPAKVTIKRGAEIKWSWRSANYAGHNVKLTKGPKGVSRSKFTSPVKVKHYSFERTFTTTGTYDFICSIHPGMNLTVVARR
ncbi:MAG: cupredoxin domain-containing protein, partial [Solirubrobacteraceae bacterium]